MSESEIVILPEDIYKLFIISDPPENFADFESFGCAECQEPVGINKPEGVQDLPPYVPKKQRLSNDGQQPNQHRQQQHKFNFQRGGKFNKGQQHQQQQQQKKIVSTVEVSPEFANKDLGTWAKKTPAQSSSPSLSPSSSSPATNVKFAPNFNPEKAPSASPYSSASFNPQQLSSSSNRSSSNSSTALFQPQSTQSYHAQQQAAQAQQQQQQQAAQAQQQQQQTQNQPQPQQQPKPAPKPEVPVQKPSGWGNVQSKPKPQSFAQLLNEESSKPSTDNRPAPSFKPETISRPHQTEQIAVTNDDKNWPSLSSISKPKTNSPWGNIKP